MNSITDKMTAYFEERQATQKAERERHEALLQDVKEYPLQSVFDFVKVKNGGTEGVAPDAQKFYAKATQADMEGYLDAAEAENLRIIKLTEDERFIHNRAAISYQDATRQQELVEAARNQLANFRQKVKVTLFDGTPVPEAEKPATGGVGVKVPVTFEEAE